MILNLDSDFKPIRNQKEIQYERFTFSGGEPHIRITNEIPLNTEVTLTHRIGSFNDMGLLLLAVDALRRMDVKIINAFIPYFPAARQDRVMTFGEPLSVKVYADLINHCGFAKITVFDPHSDVAPALLNNCQILSNHNFISKVIERIGLPVSLVSPDAGALKKSYQLAEFLQMEHLIECSKHRDVKTRTLTGFKVLESYLKGTPCLLVDDICDGGRTFIGLAKELKQKGAGKLFLAVSHGIFSQGVEELQLHFDGIFSTDSVANNVHVHKINLHEILSY
ncbi:MAG: ribose-phosphate pyrophosphokinase [Flavobacteriales bacterium]|nr:ribose-phosphate pyrophosphokinase [Flavobacteriales bacterium]